MMIHYALHNSEYLDVAKHYHKIWETPSIKADETGRGKEAGILPLQHRYSVADESRRHSNTSSTMSCLRPTIMSSQICFTASSIIPPCQSSNYTSMFHYFH